MSRNLHKILHLISKESFMCLFVLTSIIIVRSKISHLSPIHLNFILIYLKIPKKNIVTLTFENDVDNPRVYEIYIYYDTASF
jgi:hypothetical protein